MENTEKPRSNRAGWMPFSTDATAPQGKSALQSWLARAWWYIRQVSGDAAYENYLHAQQRRTHSPCGRARAPLSAREFYDDALRRRYSGVSRCC